MDESVVQVPVGDEPAQKTCFKRVQETLEDFFEISWIKILLNILQIISSTCLAFEIAEQFYLGDEMDDVFKAFSILAYIITGANVIRLICEEIIRPKPLRNYCLGIEVLLIIGTVIEFTLDKVAQIDIADLEILWLVLTCCKGLYAIYEMFISPIWRFYKRRKRWQQEEQIKMELAKVSSLS